MKKLIFITFLMMSVTFVSQAQEPMIGEVKLFAGNFAPRGWALCQGQLLPISQNTALFSILGTMYGGDGRTTFALPDLRDRVPVGAGRNEKDEIIYPGTKDDGDAVSKGNELKTQSTLGMNYIICLVGIYPSRS